VRRTYLLALIGVGVIAFLAVSGLLARVWSADGAERSAITSLLKAQARGDAAAMVARIQNCSRSATCQARVHANVAALTRPGGVSILQLEPSAGFSLSGTLGTARVAWKTASSLPIVQCVRVKRAGDVLSGLTIELLAISPRIKTDGSCPASF
jgi:hypothetical protein